MANPVEGNHLTVLQGADLSAKQYYIVKLSAGKAVLAAAATDKIIGIIARASTSSSTSEAIDIYARNASGKIKVMAGGNVSVGDYLTANASGKAVATTTAGDEVIGQALEAGVDGQPIAILAANFRY